MISLHLRPTRPGHSPKQRSLVGAMHQVMVYAALSLDSFQRIQGLGRYQVPLCVCGFVNSMRETHEYRVSG
jgi:hypothetical protein